MVCAAGGQGQRQEQDCAAQATRAAPRPPGTYLGEPRTLLRQLCWDSHPAQPCHPLSAEPLGAVPPSWWSLGSSPCGQGSLVLLEHLCLTILPPAGPCPGLRSMAWCWSCSAPLLGAGGAVRLSLPFPQVMHPALRPVAPNPCVTRGCSHLCLLSARHAGQCRCPAGLTLAADETTCLPLRDSAFALLVSPAAVAQVLSSGASPGGCCPCRCQGSGVPILVLPPSSRST